MDILLSYLKFALVLYILFLFREAIFRIPRLLSIVEVSHEIKLMRAIMECANTAGAPINSLDDMIKFLKSEDARNSIDEVMQFIKDVNVLDVKKWEKIILMVLFLLFFAIDPFLAFLGVLLYMVVFFIYPWVKKLVQNTKKNETGN